MPVSPDEDWIRCRPQAMQDYMEIISTGPRPLSGVILAKDVPAPMRAAYVSAERKTRMPSRHFDPPHPPELERHHT